MIENEYKQLIINLIENGSFDLCSVAISEDTGIDLEIVDELTTEIIDNIYEVINTASAKFYSKYK